MPRNDVDREKLGFMEECVCFNLRWVTRLVTQHFDRALRRSGVRPTQMPILAGLAARESATMAEMADWLGMERTTLLRNLQPLVRAKWVEISAARDARHSELRLTDAGRRTLQRIFPAWEKAQRQVVATLGERRWKSILADLGNATEKLGAGG